MFNQVQEKLLRVRAFLKLLRSFIEHWPYMSCAIGQLQRAYVIDSTPTIHIGQLGSSTTFLLYKFSIVGKPYLQALHKKILAPQEVLIFQIVAHILLGHVLLEG